MLASIAFMSRAFDDTVERGREHLEGRERPKQDPRLHVQA